jgi:hypothetical protein
MLVTVNDSSHCSYFGYCSLPELYLIYTLALKFALCLSSGVVIIILTYCFIVGETGSGKDETCVPVA